MELKQFQFKAVLLSISQLHLSHYLQKKTAPKSKDVLYKLLPRVSQLDSTLDSVCKIKLLPGIKIIKRFTHQSLRKTNQ